VYKHQVSQAEVKMNRWHLETQDLPATPSRDEKIWKFLSLK
jgi:hypothetical protein